MIECAPFRMQGKRTAGFAFVVVTLLTLTACIEDLAPGKTQAQVDFLCSSLERRRDETGALPTQADGLAATFEKRELFDAWQRPLHPVISDDRIVGVYSAGRDGKDNAGSGDDIHCNVKAKR